MEVKLKLEYRNLTELFLIHILATISSSFTGVSLGLMIIYKGDFEIVITDIFFGTFLVSLLVFLLGAFLLRSTLNLNYKFRILIFKIIGIATGAYFGLYYFDHYKNTISYEVIDEHIGLIFELIGMFSGYCAALVFYYVSTKKWNIQINDNRN